MSPDIISKLPDEVINMILCLLPKKEAMRTSILSKRWTSLWKSTSVHATIFDFGKEFAQSQMPEKFAASVNKCLQFHRGHNVAKFRLCFSLGEQYRDDLERWIEFATSEGIRELDLTLCRLTEGVRELDLTLFRLTENRFMKLPAILFSCTSFINLSLSCTRVKLPSRFTGFRSLQTLLLKQVSISDEVLESLISNCPALTNLCLKLCYDLYIVKISSESLECFSFIVTDADEIEIIAPNLKSLHFYGDILIGDGNQAYYFDDVNALEDFFVNANGYECTEQEHDFIKIISGVSHVKILTVSIGAPTFIAFADKYDFGELPIVLPNLEELQILVGGQIREEYLGCFLNFFRHIDCPSLDKIFIDLSGSCTPLPLDAEPAEVPLSCVFSNLKTIKINQFRGTGPEIKMVKFFLQRACALELIVLVAASDSTSIVKDGGMTPHSKTSRKSMKNLLDELVASHKSSSDVQISFFDHGEVDTSLSPFHRHTDYYVDDRV